MNVFTFSINDFEIIRMNNKSITLRRREDGQLVYVTKRVFNEIIKNEENLCMLVNKATPAEVFMHGGPTYFTWIATMMTF